MIELSVAPAAQPAPAAPAHDIRAMLRWRGWDEALEESRATGLPILCLAGNRWGNAAQRLALFLENDGELLRLATEAFVPVLTDPVARPDLTDLILNAALSLPGTAGPPLLAVLTSEGLPLVANADVHFEGSADRPSLLAVLKAASTHYREDPERCNEAARALALVPALVGDSLYLPAYSLWRQLDAGDTSTVVQTLQSLLRAGIHDQLGGGFHVAGRTEGWGVPHFEKSGAQNAAMAAVLARAASESAAGESTAGDSGFAANALAAARAAADFALQCLAAGSSGLASLTEYYTWASGEISEAVPADELQMVGLHFRISASNSRHVLNQVLAPDDAAARASGQSREAALQALESGKARLLAARSRRTPPAPRGEASLRETLVTLRWLLLAAPCLPEIHVGPLLEKLEDQLGDFLPQLPESSKRPHWLHDHAAAAMACLAAAGTTADQIWRDRAAELLELARSRFKLKGVWLAETGGRPCVGRADHELPAVLEDLQFLETTLPQFATSARAEASL